MLRALFKKDLAFFVSNIIQESITKTDTIDSFSSDASLTLLTLKLDKESQRGRGLWKFNNSLLSDKDFVLKMKDHLAVSIETLNKENIFDDQMRREF